MATKMIDSNDVQIKNNKVTLTIFGFIAMIVFVSVAVFSWGGEMASLNYKLDSHSNRISRLEKIATNVSNNTNASNIKFAEIHMLLKSIEEKIDRLEDRSK